MNDSILAAPASPEAGSAPDWAKDFPETERGVVANKGWKSAADAVKSYREAESMLGRIRSETLAKPKGEDDKEAWDKIYSTLGRPDSADKYDIKIDAQLPEGLSVQEEKLAAFKAWAHEAGLSPKQANTLINKYISDSSKEYSARAESDKAVELELKAKNNAALEDLKKEWGASYDVNLGIAAQAAKNVYGLKDEQLAEAQAVLGPKVMADIFLKLGRMDGIGTGLPGGGGSGGGIQGIDIKNDPVLRKALVDGDKSARMKIGEAVWNKLYGSK